MSELFFSSIWCAGQVVLIAGFAIVVARLLTNRRPELAARVTSWTVAAIILMTLLVPLPLPEWDVSSSNLPLAAEPTAVPIAASEHVQPDSAAVQGLPLFRFDMQRFSQAASALRATAATQQQAAVPWWIGVLLVGTAIGLVRVSAGLWAIRDLRRSAVRLSADDMACVVARSVAKKLGTAENSVVLAESDDIGCAAVVGFFRPTILLASDWREWEAHELRAVLAHEFAHVVRRDAVWRFLAVGSSAFHFFNPLVHWLTARMVLAQELAADRLAIKSMGQGAYVKSLSRLALRQDTSPRGRVQPLFTPVFAGHLMRRIEMLRAKDCERTTNRRWLSPLVLASLVAFGLGTTVARSAVQVQDGKAKADEQQSPIVQVSATTDKDQASKPFAYFQRTRVPASHPMFSRWGALHVNVAPLMEVKPLAMLLQSMMDEAMTGISPVDVSTLETLTTSLHVMHNGEPVQFTDKDGNEQTHSSRLSFAPVGLSVTTLQDVDWDKAVPRNLAKAERKSENNVTFWEAPFPAMGQAMRLVAPSKRELAIWPPQIKAPKTAGGEMQVSYPGFTQSNGVKSASTYDWATEWNAVSGGVVTVLWQADKHKGSNPYKDKFSMLRWELENQIDVIAWGFDISPGCRNVVAKFRLRCREGVSGADVSKKLKSILATLEEDLRKDVEKSDNLLVDQFFVEALAQFSPKIGVEPAGDREVVTCQIELSISEAMLIAL